MNTMLFIVCRKCYDAKPTKDEDAKELAYRMRSGGRTRWTLRRDTSADSLGLFTGTHLWPWADSHLCTGSRPSIDARSTLGCGV